MKVHHQPLGKNEKSSIASCYLKGFDAAFVLELISHISEDTNPWQPAFNADVVIAKIWRHVYPDITENFQGKDPLAALVRQYQHGSVFHD